MIEKYLNKLEFNKICEILKGYSLTYIGKDLITNLAPIVDKQDLEKALKQTSEASILLFRKGSIPISEIADLTSHIKKLNSSMGLSIKELLDLGKILKISNDLKEYFNSSDIEMDEFVYLKPLFENLYVNPSIEKEVLKAIIDEETRISSPYTRYYPKEKTLPYIIGGIVIVILIILIVFWSVSTITGGPNKTKTISYLGGTYELTK
jgi:DNA mismatch repair protein MutS2